MDESIARSLESNRLARTQHVASVCWCAGSEGREVEKGRRKVQAKERRRDSPKPESVALARGLGWLAAIASVFELGGGGGIVRIESLPNVYLDWKCVERAMCAESKVPSWHWR